MGLLNPNLSTLEATAMALEPILGDIVFVGGTIVGLLINDPGAGSARPTRDVDVIAQIAGGSGYQSATSTMLKMGFQPDTSEGAPICRWVKDGLLVDLMGPADSPFGTANPWYLEGFSTRQAITLPKTGLRIFMLSAPVFILSKWVAYQGRGQGSMTGSHDIEDILNVLDGRLGLIGEAENASPAARAALAQMVHQLFASEAFRDCCLESLGERKAVVQGVLESFAGYQAPAMAKAPDPGPSSTC